MPDPLSRAQDLPVEQRLAAAWLFLRGEALDFASCSTRQAPAEPVDGRYLLMAARLPEHAHRGGVGLVIHREDAIGVAAAMFGVDPADLSDADIDDACGEVCNVLSACVAATLSQGQSFAFDRASLLSAESYRSIAAQSVVLAAFAGAADPCHVKLAVFNPLSVPGPSETAS